MLPQGGFLHSSAVIESLERRDHFAVASPTLDPHYAPDPAPLVKIIGSNAPLFQAVAGPGDRTYVVAERFDDTTTQNFDYNGPRYLTIAAYGADGKLDPTFGTNGVALTGRQTAYHFYDESPGLLKVDGAGRIYFADSSRVLRFHADGTTDKSFGKNGAATFARATRPVQLCDIAPVDGGVMVATTQTIKGVQQFAAFKIGRTVRPVWSATHDTGVATAGRHQRYEPQPQVGGSQILAADTAQFAASRAGLVLARTESDYAYYDDPEGGGDLTGVTRQRLVVTSFDAAGTGTDLLRTTLRRPSEHEETNLAVTGPVELYYVQTGSGPILSPSGRTLTLQTENEFLRIGLRSHTVARIKTGSGDFGLAENGSARLLPDGSVWTTIPGKDTAGRPQAFAAQRFVFDDAFTHARKSGDKLSLPDDVLPNPETAIDPAQFLIGSSGRLYFYAVGGYSVNGSRFVLRRV